MIGLAGVLLLVAQASGAASQDPNGAVDESPSNGMPADDAGDASHAALYEQSLFPTAAQCAECHPRHYREWSVSQHAYAQLSPIYNAMNGTVLKATNGTSGDFCIRCHTPAGMALGEPVFGGNASRSAVAREGVTCISCHRVNKAYGKVNGRFALVPGDITAPVSGTAPDDSVIRDLLDRGLVTAESSQPGRKIHRGVEPFFELQTASSCGTCHDVTLASGFREIEAFSEYKSSPAAARGVTCQDCHMGREPGRYSGDSKTNFDWGPAARVGSEWTEPRKLTNHMMVGVDQSIVHPGIFPHNPRAIRESGENTTGSTGMATFAEWLQFDWKAGWGTDEFEDEVSEEMLFPERWSSIDDRYDARDIIEENLELLEIASIERIELLRNGYLLGEIRVDTLNEERLEFAVEVRNGTDGHGVPTGLDAERPVWLHIVVRDADGRLLLESGDLDPNGDLRDLFSAYVRSGEVPLDDQLFNLQSKFITRNLRGGEREQVLPIPFSLTPLPFVRPARSSSILMGRPLSVRKHKKNIEPLGQRWASYSLSAGGESWRDPLQLEVELKAATEPVNLVNAIKSVGFDYGMTPREVADALVETQVVIWQRTLLLEARE